MDEQQSYEVKELTEKVVKTPQAPLLSRKNLFVSESAKMEVKSEEPDSLRNTL